MARKRGRKTGSTLTKPKLPAAAGSRRAPKKPIPAGLDGLDDEFDGTLTSAKTATERRRARLMEIELQMRRGELVRQADVDRHNFGVARTLRNRVMGISPRIAAAAFASESVADCQRILDRELRLALEVLADELEHEPA